MLFHELLKPLLVERRVTWHRREGVDPPAAVRSGREASRVVEAEPLDKVAVHVVGLKDEGPSPLVL